MRVALVGNMNNNHFAVMRYLRDLGVDASLLMYTNEHEHFLPQCDTWDWERWEPHVKTLPVSNGGADGVLVRRRVLEEAFDGYDVFLGNGISPVLFARMGRILDIFAPYSEGVEFVIQYHRNWKRPRSTVLQSIRKRLMERALVSSVGQVITSNLHPHSQNTFRRLGLTPLTLPMPQLYVEKPPSDLELPEVVEAAIARMRQSDLVVFSHVAHAWKNLPVPHYGGGVGKRNQWLIEGFAEYVKSSGNRKALLCLLEYGIDVPVSRQLIAALGVADQVVWLPQMQRREILCLMPYVDLGGSEFSEMMWGSTGWEFLASGVPMVHQLRDTGEYARQGVPLPPFFNVDSPGEIAAVLATHDRASLRAMGERCQEWFRQHHGASLARRYAELLGNVFAGREARPARAVAG